MGLYSYIVFNFVFFYPMWDFSDHVLSVTSCVVVQQHSNELLWKEIILLANFRC